MSLSLDKLFRLPRRHKRFVLTWMDMGLVSGSLLLAILLRTGSNEALTYFDTWLLIAMITPATLMLFTALGLYRHVLRFLGYKTLKTLMICVCGSALLIALANVIIGQPLPHSVSIIYALLSLSLVGGVRLLLRSLYRLTVMRQTTRVIIYGAGSAGSQLVTSLNNGHEYTPVGFVDDWRGMHGTRVEGLKVYPPGELPRLIQTMQVERILFAIPSAPLSRKRHILQTLEPLTVPVQTVPGMADIVAGHSRIEELRDITIDDLLGRDPIPPNQSLLDANIRGKVVMVTGAGGSIGSELCRQILVQGPAQLLLLDICEYSLYRIERELQNLALKTSPPAVIRALLGSVQQRSRLDDIMRTFHVQTIYHAAAYKHVPIVENNMVEGIRNNVFGTLEMARAAIDCGVDTFVLISTDKAVRPTNVMGTTKRLAELICQSLAAHQSMTRFCMVRFGNVLGSSGSVVPLFRKQIKAGGPITVTHPDITRYFMTIPEAAQLVIQAGAMGRGGDVFVLDMGEPIKIDELARKIVRLSGMEIIDQDNPDGDIEIVYSGLRPGEKLFEELLIGDGTVPTSHPRIMSANEAFWDWPTLNAYLQRLYATLSNHEYDRIRELLREAPTAYQPDGPIVDPIHQSKSAEPATTKVTSAEEDAFDVLKVSAVSLVKGGPHF